MLLQAVRVNANFRIAGLMVCFLGFVSVCLGAITEAASSATKSSSKQTVSDAQVVETINRLLASSWSEDGIVPSREAPDGAWARRIYLDLVGRVPTIEELEAFAEVKRKSRRTWLIDQLLGSQYSEERARWLATQWANTLIGRTGGNNRQSLAKRPGFMQYLRDSFGQNRPMDQLMTELVTATGSVRPEDEDFNPASNFLADKMEERGIQATAMTSQVFLGVSVQCTQCHNHPFNENKQNQFWEMNAFFRQARVERIREEDNNRRYARIVNRNYYGEGRNRPVPAELVSVGADRAESYYELRNGKLKVAYPVFLNGTSLVDVFAERDGTTGEPKLGQTVRERGNSGRLSQVNRREELAAMIADSDEFPRSLVNREWERYFGYGFSRPAIDMGPHNPPSHPELLEELAKAFRDTGFDMNRLTRWIVSSEAYGLDSRAKSGNKKDDPTLGVAPMFSRYYLRQLTAEQIYESLITATQADKQLSEARRDQARNRWLRQFTTAFGNDENGESNSFNGSIPQALAMMNSDLMRQATSVGSRRGSADDDQGFLASIANDESLDNRERIEKIYLAAVARKPEKGEIRLCNRLLEAREGNAAEALRDIWWALLNSNEFILQH